MLVSKKILVVCISALMASGCGTMTARDIDTLPASAALPEKSVPGQVAIWFYDNVTVSSVDELENLARYPENPDEISSLSRLEISGDRADRYGSLVRGYITPLTDGQYRFFINSDGDSKFLLSKSNIPSDTRTIASVPGYTKFGDFDKYTSQTSAEITLSADQEYYFEIRHREGGGTDHFSVAWEGPGFGRSVIDGQYLSSFAKGSQTYPDDEKTVAGYALGYRVGFFDGKQEMPFTPAYPPLDIDQDGLYDNWEVFHGMDTANANDVNSDQDDDILTNYDEFWVGTSPASSDSDKDGIPDGVEFAYGLDPLNVNDAQEDFDNDGFTNIEEFQAGSDLTNSYDVPVKTEARVAGVQAQYFSGVNFDKFVVAKMEAALDFDWGAGSPAPGVPADRFSARYLTQFIPIHENGDRDYRVVIKRDGGVRLDFNGQRVVDKWQGSLADISSRITATAGETYPVTVEYNEGTGNAYLSIQFIDATNGQVQNAAEVFSVLDASSTTNAAVDSDNDGIPDLWEYQQGSNVHVADSSTVNNAVGISNLEAFQSNLNPWTTSAIEGSTSTLPNITPSTPPPTNPGQSLLSLVWTAPLTRVDGNSMPLSDIKGYELRYGREPDALDKQVEISGQDTQYTLENLEPGIWYFRMRTYDYNGTYSAFTDILEYTVK